LDADARFVDSELIQTAKLNSVDLMSWFADVLEQFLLGRTKVHENAHTAAVELEHVTATIEATAVVA
jgi:hypothetical protein